MFGTAPNILVSWHSSWTNFAVSAEVPAILRSLVLFGPAVFLAVFGGDLADDPRRIAGGEAVGRDIADDDRTRRDDRIVADRYAADDRDRTADPDVIAHGHREGVFPAVDAVLHIQRMPGGQYRDVGSDPDVVAEFAVVAVEHDEIVVGEKVFADLDAEAVIAFEGRQDIAAFADLAEDLSQKIAAFLNLGGTEPVVFVDRILDLEAEIGHFGGAVRVVEQSGFGFFLLGHAARNRLAENRLVVHDRILGGSGFSFGGPYRIRSESNVPSHSGICKSEETRRFSPAEARGRKRKTQGEDGRISGRDAGKVEKNAPPGENELVNAEKWGYIKHILVAG